MSNAYVSERTSVTRRTVMAAAATAAALPVAGQLSLAIADEAAPQYDAIVVGTGVAGMSAALRLQQEGANILVIEKQGTAGGNSRVSQGGFLLPPTDDQDGADAMFADVMDKSGGRADASLARVLADNAYRAYHWIEDNGYATWFNNGIYQPYHCFSCVTNEGIYTLMENMAAAFEQAGGQIRYSTKLRDLLTDENENVVGVKVKGPEGVEYLYAKSVILASGGYSANKGMLEQYAGANADDIATRGFHANTGDGVNAALRLGAGLIQVGGYESMHVAGVHPESVSFGDPGSAVGPSLAINTQGKRFVDESLGYVSHGKALIDQPGGTDYIVLDQGMIENEVSGFLIAWSMMQWCDIAGLPLVEADTLEELAEKIGVPTDAFLATVEEFNAAVDEQTMTTSGLEHDKAALAFKLQTPPFVAFGPLVPGCCITLGGLQVDDGFQVLEPDGSKIANLYAAGEITGGLFYDDYIGGTALMSALVMGIVSAESAIANLA